ncbi:MAG: cytochrome c peroxidase [Nannocystaceae bacterium]
MTTDTMNPTTAMKRMTRMTRMNQRPRAIRALAIAATIALAGACGGDKEPPPKAIKAAKPKKGAADAAPSGSQLLTAAKKFFSPLPAVAESAANPITPEKVTLGRILYYDPRLSKNHDVSCNSCHKLDNFGVDNEGTSPGHRAQRGERNSPTVYNAAAHFAQFWDGRAATVEEQAGMPVLNPVEMAMGSEAQVVDMIKTIPGYEPLFKSAFPSDGDPITYRNIGMAIGAFERGLMTPGPFDEFLKGNITALGPDALKGLQLFIDIGCTNCHVGPTLGGTMFQKLGSAKKYETKDEGRFKITGNPEDKFVFKVPSLRNISHTAPYLHDGSAENLDAVLSVMAEYQTAKGHLDDDERTAIKAFLSALDGTIDPAYIAKPDLPENGPKTPAPDPD